MASVRDREGSWRRDSDRGRLANRQHILEVIRNLFGFEAKCLQVDAIETLAFDREDLILIAKTGFGKSIIFQALPFIFPRVKSALIIMPLKGLEKEQCEKLQRIAGCKPFVLEGDNNNRFNLQRIRRGEFTHVFTSPEIAISRTFNDDVLRHPEFSVNLGLLAIDEIHLVSEWKEFRPDYFALGVLRARLPDGIPFLGASATLDKKTLDLVIQSCAFKERTRVLRTPLDRPEIYIQVSPLLHSMRSMIDLQHLLPMQVDSQFDIPKTIIFMESIQLIKVACELIRLWMKQLKYPTHSSGWVSPYFSDMATKDKELVGAHFGQESAECQDPRILVATEAYGLGIDNPDIARVVQWGVPSTISKLYQRMGRGMRAGCGQAHYTLLHPQWCIGPQARGGEESVGLENSSIEGFGADPRAADEVEDINEANADDGNDNAQISVHGPRGKRSDAERRSRLGPGLWALMNVPVDGCVRDAGLNFFSEDGERAPPYEKPPKCCSVCNPSHQVPTVGHNQLNQRQEADPLRRPWYTERLRGWRAMKARESHPGYYLQFFPTLVMPDSVLTSLVQWAEYIVDESSMKRWVGGGWAEMSRYSPEILEILAQGRAMDCEEGEVLAAWTLRNDIRAGRVPAPSINQGRIDFMARRESWISRGGGKRGPGAAKGKARGKRGARSGSQGPPRGDSAPGSQVVGAEVVRQQRTSQGRYVRSPLAALAQGVAGSSARGRKGRPSPSNT